MVQPWDLPPEVGRRNQGPTSKLRMAVPPSRAPQAEKMARVATGVTCHLSSVQNPCWLMIFLGIILPNILGIAIVQSGKPHKPTSAME